MINYLIDVNLPANFSLWHHPNFRYQSDIDPGATDKQIWQYAEKHKLVIVTKDADFVAYALSNSPPPRVVQLKIGNLKLKDLYHFVKKVWPDIEELIPTHKLLIVYSNRIECIGD